MYIRSQSGSFIGPGNPLWNAEWARILKRRNAIRMDSIKKIFRDAFSPKMTLKSRYSVATVGGFVMDVWMKNLRRKISAEKIYGIEKPAD